MTIFTGEAPRPESELARQNAELAATNQLLTNRVEKLSALLRQEREAREVGRKTYVRALDRAIERSAKWDALVHAIRESLADDFREAAGE